MSKRGHFIPPLLHVEGSSIRTSALVMLLDRSALGAPATREFIGSCRGRGLVAPGATSPPKSAIVCNGNVIFSRASTGALSRRLRQMRERGFVWPTMNGISRF